MKIGFGSDLHFEFGLNSDKHVIYPECDVLCLCGDIYLPHRGTNDNVKNFFRKCCAAAKHVLYVPGNHDYWHGLYQGCLDIMRKDLKEFTNLTINELGTVKIDDVVFFMSTFWTDCNHGDINTMQIICYGMNDYSRIKGFTVHDSFEKNVEARIKLKNVSSSIANDEKFVIMTHHSPTFNGIDKFYEGDPLNAAYANSGLDEFIEESKIDYWFYGHSHSVKDIEIGKTKVMRNPCGYYGYERYEEPYSFKVVEL